MKYACDTNVLVDVLRDATLEADFAQFLLRHSHSVYLSAVVVLELRAGVRTREQGRILDRSIARPFHERGRVFAPSSTAFALAGDVLADLARRERWTAAAQPFLVHDTLIAASCREAGITLITRDQDFDRIRSRLRGFKSVPPWPGVSTDRR